MRKNIIKDDKIECVIGLGANLFYNSPMEACIVICRSKKLKERKNKILFINAVNEVTREQAQSFLTMVHIDQIDKTYKAFEDKDGFAKVMDTNKLRDFSLSIPLYVHSSNGLNGFMVSEEQAEYNVSSQYEKWCAQTDTLYEKIELLINQLEEMDVEK